MMLDALGSIQTDMLAKEQGIVMANWDLKATKLVTGYD